MTTFGHDPFEAPRATVPIDAARAGRRAVISGHVTDITLRAWAGDVRTLEVTITDQTSALTLCFFGRTHILGVGPGRQLAAAGGIIRRGARLIMINPQLWLLAPDRRTQTRPLSVAVA